MTQKILVADDDERLASMVANFLKTQGYQIEIVADGATALAKLGTFKPDVLITDVQMPALDGFTLLKHAQESYPNCAVVVMTGYGSVEAAGRAKQFGALHYLQKPFPPEDLVNILSRLKSGAKAAPNPGDQFPEIIGESREMREVFSKILQVANTDLSVLVQGETGTGKELVATAIHRLSFRNRGRFVVVNCAELNTELFESELFGHVRGAFTGATTNRDGLMAAASGGSLFLDEIGEIDKRNQAKLLRALETGEIRRVGDTKPLKVDIRFVAATNVPLRRAAAEGEFRSDLFFRLAAFTIELPPLRERREDIPLLANSLLKGISEESRIPLPELGDNAIDRLMQHHWPGNIRELKNCLAMAMMNCVNAKSSVLTADHIMLTSASQYGADVNPMAHPGYRGFGKSDLAPAKPDPVKKAPSPERGFDRTKRRISSSFYDLPPKIKPDPTNQEYRRNSGIFEKPVNPEIAKTQVFVDKNNGKTYLELPDIDMTKTDIDYRQLRDDLLKRFDNTFFSRLLTKTRGNISKAARITSLDRKRLREKITGADLSADDFR